MVLRAATCAGAVTLCAVTFLDHAVIVLVSELSGGCRAALLGWVGIGNGSIGEAGGFDGMGTSEVRCVVPAAEVGHTTVFEFPYRTGGTVVRSTLRIRWEDDPSAGLCTAWWASFSRPPWRLDGDLPGLVPVEALAETVAGEHRAAEEPTGLLNRLRTRV